MYMGISEFEASAAEFEILKDLRDTTSSSFAAFWLDVVEHGWKSRNVIGPAGCIRTFETTALLALKWSTTVPAGSRRIVSTTVPSLRIDTFTSFFAGALFRRLTTSLGLCLTK